jgi:hypothetical protein
MIPYWILDNGDAIQAGDEIWNYIFMEWESISDWEGKKCDHETAASNQPIRRKFDKP